MNEQQLADLYSEQIDRMLQGQQSVAPADAADLQQLLALGQQFSQINFQPSATAQAAFQTQVSAWFGPLNGGTATAAWGLSKTLWLTLTAAVITIGATLGVVVLTSLPNPQQQIVPDAPEAPQESLENPASDDSQATPVPSAPTAVPTSNGTVSDGDTLSPSSSSTGDTLSPATLSTGDTLPSTPVLKESLPLPTSEPSPTAEIINGVDGDEPTADEDGNDSATDTTDDDTSTGDHDKGHGNDEDGVDEDNPGNSSGLPDSDQGNNPGGPNFDQFSSGGGNNGNGGQGGGSGNNNNGDNRGNSGGQGKGKGKK